MEISDIQLEMELNGVSAADIADLLKLCDQKGFDSELIDNELIKRGYDKIFTVDYDDYDDWEDDDYAQVEKFPYKKGFMD